MKQTLRTAFLFLMLVTFLTGTTGVSFYIHECSSSRKKEIVAFPEILNKTVSCCCAEEVHGTVPSDEPVSSFDEPDCCKNTHVYLKAIFIGFPVFHQFNPDLFQKIIFGAAADARRDVRILRKTSHAFDHPINIYHPEGEYLKGLLCEVN